MSSKVYGWDYVSKIEDQMNFRWKVDKVVYDYFTHVKDPVLQVFYEGEWVDIPTETIEHDERKYKESRNTAQKLPNKVQANMQRMPEYPNTSRNMDKSNSEVGMSRVWPFI